MCVTSIDLYKNLLWLFLEENMFCFWYKCSFCFLFLIMESLYLNGHSSQTCVHRSNGVPSLHSETAASWDDCCNGLLRITNSSFFCLKKCRHGPCCNSSDAVIANFATQTLMEDNGLLCWTHVEFFSHYRGVVAYVFVPRRYSMWYDVQYDVLNMAMCLNVCLLRVEVARDQFYIASCKSLFGKCKSGLGICFRATLCQLVLFPIKPSAIDCLPEVLEDRLWGVSRLKMTFSITLLSFSKKQWILEKHPSHWFIFFSSYLLAAPAKEGRGGEARIRLRWSHWLVDLLKCAVYMSVLNVLTLRGTVEQLASAVPERLTRGSRAHSVSCWQIPANGRILEQNSYA